MREIHEELGTVLMQVKPFKVTRIELPGGTLELNTFTGVLRGPVVLEDHELMAYGWFSLESLQIMRERLRLPILLEHAQKLLISLSSVVGK
ncbi:hypothetical protein KSF_102190 [Reticulibacter mediterranei]|uniref:Nudix hydrolase domain-containing protein n=1 Tax=Reticulibacter mediterranei TaxID=2778369 RepID=A0A8J3J227_9CHLR|nr:hypothetical protein KSF_102190 [Reticulibacter mediterranei]